MRRKRGVGGFGLPWRFSIAIGVVDNRVALFMPLLQLQIMKLFANKRRFFGYLKRNVESYKKMNLLLLDLSHRDNLLLQSLVLPYQY